MLGKKARQHNTTERQNNTTQLAQNSYFQRKKLPQVAFEPSIVRLLGVRSYQLSCRGSSAGWARIKCTMQSNQSITNQINRWTWYKGEGRGNQTSKDTKHHTKYIHDLNHLWNAWKKGKATQHNRKTKQHNKTRPRQLFSKKETASGRIQTHDRALARLTCMRENCFGLAFHWDRLRLDIRERYGIPKRTKLHLFLHHKKTWHEMLANMGAPMVSVA